jgi:hypothetical protein
MVLRAKSALQTACQRGRALFHGLALSPATPVRPQGPPGLQLPRIRRKNLPVSLTAALQFLPTRVGGALPPPGSRIRAGTAQQWSFVRPRLCWHTGCRMFGSMDFRNPSMNLQAHKPKPPVEEPTPEPDERSPVEEPDRPDPRSPPERPRR